MNKVFTILAILLVSATCITNKQILQLFLNGLFEQNLLPDPTTVVPCIDEVTAGKIVVFIGEVLSKAAKGSVSDLLALKDLFKKFGDQIPQPVKDCLDGNKQFQALQLKYGIDNNTDTSALEKKVIEYITFHYFGVHKQLGDLNNEWKALKYYQTGYDLAKFVHKLVSVTSKVILPELTNKQILQQNINGMFAQNNLPNPTTIIPCIDEDTAGKIVKFIGDTLEKAARGSASDYYNIIQDIKAFGDSIPQPVKDCLNVNAQLKTLGLKYGIDETTDTSQLEKKILAYAALHYFAVHKWLGDLNTEWKAGQYYQTGYDGAGYAHKVLDLTPQQIRRIVGFV